jgi:hypothetical protein
MDAKVPLRFLPWSKEPLETGRGSRYPACSDAHAVSLGGSKDQVQELVILRSRWFSVSLDVSCLEANNKPRFSVLQPARSDTKLDRDAAPEPVPSQFDSGVARISLEVEETVVCGARLAKGHRAARCGEALVCKFACSAARPSGLTKFLAKRKRASEIAVIPGSKHARCEPGELNSRAAVEQ